MTIEPDVRAVAKNFGISASILQAVVHAEGGGASIIRAVQCSVPSVQTRDEALRVTARSIAHALSDYVIDHGLSDFIAFFGARWAPLGVANDPRNLNANWVPNVKRLLGVAADASPGAKA